jgi:hypothetical protein
MIENDDQLEAAEQAVAKLKLVLREARRVEPASVYRAMSEPFLAEIRKREAEILEYLASTREEVRA